MKKKILVVDDDLVQRDLYTELFEGKKFEVMTANDGLAGLELALKAKPDLVFSGIIMPRMDGFEMVRNLRANIATAEIPVMMFSHLGREEDKEKAGKFSNVTFLVKGYDSPADILKKTEDLIGAAES
jgi:CheY-like chemotaxis protein